MLLSYLLAVMAVGHATHIAAIVVEHLRHRRQLRYERGQALLTGPDGGPHRSAKVLPFAKPCPTRDRTTSYTCRCTVNCGAALHAYDCDCLSCDGWDDRPPATSVPSNGRKVES
jgi:hypothetical protein